ncbi:MAG: rod shape-determining protein [Lachnospiraceae bacterium]|nr:rod shape-determining protein [Lachnospiraceae bacterium]
MKKTIVLDFGSAYLRIGKPNGEVVTIESVAAADKKSGNPVAFGDEARHLSERTPGGVELIHPFTDMNKLLPDMTEGMLREAANAAGRPRGFRADLAVSLPGSPSDSAEEFFAEKAGDAGACEVVVVSPTTAVSHAAGIGKLADALIVHLGASVTEISLFSAGEEKTYANVPVGGRFFDDAIGEYVFGKYGVLLDEDTCEKVKNGLASLIKPEEGGKEAENSLAVRGVSRKSGLPKTVTLTEAELYPVVLKAFVPIAEGIGNVLGNGDVHPEKTVLSGGFAVMKGMREAIAALTRGETEIMADPEIAVTAGLMRMIDTEVI